MHRWMKRFFLFFTLLLTFSLIGCNGTSLSSNREKESNIAQYEAEKTHSEVTTEETGPTANGETHSVKEPILEKKQEVSINKQITSSKDSTNPAPKTNTQAAKGTTKKATVITPTKNSDVKEENKKTINNITAIPKTVSPKQNPPSDSVTISVIGSKDIGEIISPTKISIKKEDTVLDVLLKVAKKKNIDVEYSGNGAMAYIEGIDNLYEFDYGPKSGWNFKLNGTTVNKSADSVIVKNKDKIEWIYREDFTEEK